ncbi:hypothetical protein TRFO_04643 [Tritrichomonas foetus]|uniref:Uncharacterized protein n=1 Tax=Tritrichomonas foetus TaxID=1144522 RepID=A0A1J4KID8_9EUKA|nr:hypothetical protein TRFO_04643 [Tritrichomonas foetus]|eukprot:OHT09069.1 hypothetical protein TRFO_04643 [Tritrichomonas foetus]
MGDKQIIAPYVRAMKLENLETSIQVADQALLYYQHLKYNFQKKNDPGVCVALSLYKFKLETDDRLRQIASMQGIPNNFLVRRISDTRQLLDIPYEVSYEEIAKEINIPTRFAVTANKIFDDLKNEFPDDKTINRAAIKAAIMLVVAIKRGYKREKTMNDLSRVTTTDPKAILENELMIRTLIGNRYGGKNLAPKPTEPVPKVAADEHIKEITRQEIGKMAKKQKNKAKKIQKKLDFGFIPRKETFKVVE